MDTIGDLIGFVDLSALFPMLGIIRPTFRCANVFPSTFELSTS
jgi:hypothetical protein